MPGLEFLNLVLISVVDKSYVAKGVLSETVGSEKIVWGPPVS